MRPALLSSIATIAAALAAGACPGSGNGVGAPCEATAACANDLQCLDQICVPRCQRAPDCGDGHACTEDGRCVVGDRQSGDRCTSEVECEPGLACVLDVTDGGDGTLEASCSPDRDGHAFGAACDRDDACRNATCALGRCVDVCAIDRDCASAHVCTSIPRIVDTATGPAHHGTFRGCLPAGGSIEWTTPVTGPADDVYVGVPGNARSVVIAMSVDDEAQYVGADELRSPAGAVLFDDPHDPFAPTNAIRHRPRKHQSALMIPSVPGQLVPGAYLLRASSFRLNPLPSGNTFVLGSATPRVKAVAKLGGGTVLDLHFYFLDLAAHPCQAQIGAALTAAAAAQPDSAFQDQFVAQLRLIFARAGISLGSTTYDDLTAGPGHPDLDGLDAAALPDLLALSTRPSGVSVFLVRTITPVGIQALTGGGDNPGDPSVGARTGGVAIGIDTLCYRSWHELARVTAHGVARHMGLFRNVEPEGPFEDPLGDSPGREDLTEATMNLMHFSEFGGSTLSDGQKDILRRSAVLR